MMPLQLNFLFFNGIELAFFTATINHQQSLFLRRRIGCFTKKMSSSARCFLRCQNVVKCLDPPRSNGPCSSLLHRIRFKINRLLHVCLHALQRQRMRRWYANLEEEGVFLYNYVDFVINPVMFRAFSPFVIPSGLSPEVSFLTWKAMVVGTI